MTRIVAVVLMLFGCAHFQPEDRALGALTTGMIAADCGLTAAVLRYPNTVERNPLLGKRPSPAELGAWCAAGAVATWGVAAIAPDGFWRRAFLFGVLAIESVIVVRTIRVLERLP